MGLITLSESGHNRRVLSMSAFDGTAELVGAAMWPACWCGADPWPLAI